MIIHVQTISRKQKKMGREHAIMLTAANIAPPAWAELHRVVNKAVKDDFGGDWDGVSFQVRCDGS